MIRRTFKVAMATVLFAALAMGGAAPAVAADEPVVTFRALRMCDPTGCYVAWHVVDSDHDGVCDADELAAGTDPHDSNSRPPMKHVAELAFGRALPSFEFGLGAFILFPPEIMQAREKLGINPLGAFPMHERADALTRMGISAETMSKYGLSAERDGFSLGLDRPDSTSKLPGGGPRVSGIQTSLISGGEPNSTGAKPNSHVSRGGVMSSERDGNSRVLSYGDGSTDTITPMSDGTRVTGTRVTTKDDEGKVLGSKEVAKTRDYKDGATHVILEDTKTYDADGRLSSQTQSETHNLASGATNTLTVTTDYVRDGDGKVIGIKTTTENTYTSADGNFSSQGKTTKVCDGSGNQCSEQSAYTDSTEKKYVDPEQAYNNMVSQEMVDNTLRLRGAAVNVVRGWNAPGMEETPTNPSNPSTIMLVDSSIGDFYLLAEPTRLTAQAQPETRPDLRNPMQGAPGPSSGGGCEGLC